MRIINIKGYILTPVHIGNDNIVNPLEYIVKDDKCHMLNLDKLANVNPSLAKQFANAVSELSISEAQKILFDELDDDFVKYSTFVDPAFVKDYQKRANDTEYPPNIHLMTRSPYPHYQPIIRGSAVKGAIRTAYLSNLFDNLPNDEKNNLQNKRNGPRAHDLKMLWREGTLIDSLSTIMGEDLYNPDRDNFKSLNVEDVYLESSDSEITRVCKASMKSNGDVNFTRPEYIEVIPGIMSKKPQHTNFTLKLILTDNSLFDSWSSIKEHLDDYFVSEIRREVSKKGWVSQFFWEDVAVSIEDQLSYLDDKSTLIRIGGHIGLNFTAIRGLMPRAPKTRNLFDEGAPLGIIRLEVEEETQI